MQHTLMTAQKFDSQLFFTLTLSLLIASVAFVSTFDTAVAELSDVSEHGDSEYDDEHKGKECPSKNKKSGEKPNLI